MHCPPEQWLQIEKHVWHMRAGGHIHRLFYDSEARLGIIKCIPSRAHELVKGLFECEFIVAVRAMNVNPAPLGATKFTSANHSSREGDSTWQPVGRAPLGWPGLVIEVGYSQSLPSLGLAARWWLESRPLITTPGYNYGRVVQVILLNIIPHNHQIMIESWILGPHPGRTRNSGNRPGVAIQSQPTITLTSRFDNNTNTYVTTSPGPFPLTILWAAISENPPHAGQGNVVFGMNILQVIADGLWPRI